MIRIPIFISHSWAYSDHYVSLASWIFDEQWNVSGTPLIFEDMSVPKDNPIHNAQNDLELASAIYARIVQSNVVVIPTGMYANYSKWIQKEIDGANYYQSRY